MEIMSEPILFFLLRARDAATEIIPLCRALLNEAVCRLASDCPNSWASCIATGGTTRGPVMFPTQRLGLRNARIDRKIRALIRLAKKMPATSRTAAATMFPRSACQRKLNKPFVGIPIATLQPETVERLKLLNTLTPSRVVPSNVPSPADISACLRSGLKGFFLRQILRHQPFSPRLCHCCPLSPPPNLMGFSDEHIDLAHPFRKHPGRQRVAGLFRQIAPALRC